HHYLLRILGKVKNEQKYHIYPILVVLGIIIGNNCVSLQRVLVRGTRHRWLRFSVQLSNSKSGNVGNSRILLPKAIQRIDRVNAHAIGVGSLILYCRRFLRPPD
ncbi:MAG: hypothetical protein J5965_04110, partial [Aeriscardovia sp.]|nr:hypothetical protein [Aeriscardovia sp.]